MKKSIVFIDANLFYRDRQ